MPPADPNAVTYCEWWGPCVCAPGAGLTSLSWCCLPPACAVYMRAIGGIPMTVQYLGPKCGPRGLVSGGARACARAWRPALIPPS